MKRLCAVLVAGIYPSTMVHQLLDKGYVALGRSEA